MCCSTQKLLVVEELVEHVCRVLFGVAVAEYLLLEDIARILLQQLAKIGLDHWIGGSPRDVNGDPIGGRGGHGLAENAPADIP